MSDVYYDEDGTLVHHARCAILKLKKNVVVK